MNRLIRVPGLKPWSAFIGGWEDTCTSITLAPDWQQVLGTFAPANPDNKLFQPSLSHKKIFCCYNFYVIFNKTYRWGLKARYIITRFFHISCDSIQYLFRIFWPLRFHIKQIERNVMSVSNWRIYIFLKLSVLQSKLLWKEKQCLHLQHLRWTEVKCNSEMISASDMRQMLTWHSKFQFMLMTSNHDKKIVSSKHFLILIGLLRVTDQ